MGEGFAILDRTSSADTTPAWPALCHTITWCHTNDFFYATWKEMELHCARCHQPGHHVRHCPDNPQKNRACYACGVTGHIAADCPRSTSTRGATPKKKRKARSQPTSLPGNTHDPQDVSTNHQPVSPVPASKDKSAQPTNQQQFSKPRQKQVTEEAEPINWEDLDDDEDVYSDHDAHYIHLMMEWKLMALANKNLMIPLNNKQTACYLLSTT